MGRITNIPESIPGLSSTGSASVRYIISWTRVQRNPVRFGPEHLHLVFIFHCEIVLGLCSSLHRSNPLKVLYVK
jgi:hypothetical protein